MDENGYDAKFYRFMRLICEEYNNWKSAIPIREVDRFMSKIVEIYQELERK